MSGPLEVLIGSHLFFSTDGALDASLTVSALGSSCIGRASVIRTSVLSSFSFLILCRSLARTPAGGTRVFNVSSFMHNSASPSTCSALELKKKYRVKKGKLKFLKLNFQALM